MNCPRLPARGRIGTDFRGCDARGRAGISLNWVGMTVERGRVGRPMTESNFHIPLRRPIPAAPIQGPFRHPQRRASGTPGPAAPEGRPQASAQGGGGASGNAIYRRAGKRIFDIGFVLAATPVALMLVGVSALLLWLEGGNPFYRQDRLGRGGRVFSILKLRTMVRDADRQLEAYLADDPALRHEWDTTQKLKNDPRITSVGSFLRKTSLDELPQLWNVLIGDMSIVGPRPMMPDQLELYGDPHHYFALKPGITGFWQVSERNNSIFQSRTTLDADYHRRLSLHQDFRVLFLTVGAVVRRTGY